MHMLKNLFFYFVNIWRESFQNNAMPCKTNISNKIFMHVFFLAKAHLKDNHKNNVSNRPRIILGKFEKPKSTDKEK
jgi:hypothetical protein